MTGEDGEVVLDSKTGKEKFVDPSERQWTKKDKKAKAAQKLILKYEGMAEEDSERYKSQMAEYTEDPAGYLARARAAAEATA